MNFKKSLTSRVVVVGGGVAGVYFIYELLKRLYVPVVLIDPSPHHEFPIGIPIAAAGLVEFEELKAPFKEFKKITYIRGSAAVVEDKCVRLSTGPVGQVCGDYVVLAPGGVKVGSAEYWSVSGAERLLKKITEARGVRFVVNVDTPVIGFQEIAYSIKSRYPDKDVSIHLVYVSHDYTTLLEVWKKWASSIGVELTDEPPPQDGTLHISVPALLPHPLAAEFEIDPVTFQTQNEGVYVIGDSSLIKLGLPPIGWGALWQASTLARAIATEISKGVFELEAAPWSDVATREGFYRWLTYRMTSGTPLSHLKGLLDRWRGILNFLKEV